MLIEWIIYRCHIIRYYTWNIRNCESWTDKISSRGPSAVFLWSLPIHHHPKEPLVMSIQYTTCLIWYYYVTHMSSVMSLKDLPFFMHIWIRSFTCVRCPPKILFGIISYLNIVLTWLLACKLVTTRTSINWPYPLSRIRHDRLALSSEPVTIELRALTTLS
jgi:hypothetical protein